MSDLLFVTPINQLGYGIVGLNLLKTFSKKHRVSLWPINSVMEAPPEDHDLISLCAKERTKMFEYHAPSLRLYHQNDMALHPSIAFRTGFPIFELDTFKPEEIFHLSLLDHIFVASKWAKEVVENHPSINRPVTVAPLGVDTSIFFPAQSREVQETVFFNCGKWEVRKGHDILVEAFNKAFTPNDKVRLVLNCHNPFLNETEQETWRKLYLNSKMGDRITIIPERLETQQQLAGLMNSVDVGVFPARAEGWNLELLEMMACGKQIITTNYSAHTEFATNLNSNLIPITEKEIAYDGKWFKGDGEWAQLGDTQLDSMIHYMRTLHKRKQQGGDMYNAEGVKTAKLYSWDATADTICGVLFDEKYRNQRVNT